MLGDPKLEAQWRAECSQMAERIIAMRAALSKALTAAGSTRDWSHVTSQIGMFCFSGMCADRMRSHGVAWGRMG